MRVAIVTLFPEIFTGFLGTSLVARAIADRRLEVELHPLREHGIGKHRSVDDTPYGGGSGMVMRVDCVVEALEAAEAKLTAGGRAHRVLLTPQGARMTQVEVASLALEPSLVLVCGRYEGFDERVRSFVDRELSLGDFVMTGGEVAAMAVIEACVRLVPGVLGNADSPLCESFSPECRGMLEYPQYTRPQSFRGLAAPEVLRSGDHARIDEWRREQSRSRTLHRRPDLVTRAELGKESR
jgi:tRNA (guanine37-N1)-methyltransferase